VHTLLRARRSDDEKRGAWTSFGTPIARRRKWVCSVGGAGYCPFLIHQFVWIAVFSSLVTLFQQMHVIFYPVLVLALVAIWFR
jgi:hypothetical protein